MNVLWGNKNVSQGHRSLAPITDTNLRANRAGGNIQHVRHCHHHQLLLLYMFLSPLLFFCSYITEQNHLICPTQIIKLSLQDTGNLISLSSFSCQMNHFHLFRGVVLTSQRLVEYLISHSKHVWAVSQQRLLCNRVWSKGSLTPLFPSDRLKHTTGPVGNSET